MRPGNLRAALALLVVWVLLRGIGMQAQLPLLPSAVLSDAAGNLYIADTNRNQVLESTAAGALIVLAGTGEQGFAGDGGAATGALLNGPQGLALAGDGTLYVADTGNQRVRAIAPGGLISTFAGTGRAGFAGDGGAAGSAWLHTPVALALDGAGALLIADSLNHRVRKVSGGVITTVAGSGVEGFSGDTGPATAAALDTPMGLAVAADGSLLIADSHNHRLRSVAADGTIATIAGVGVAGFSGDGGAAKAARLSLPRGVAVLGDGTIVFADANNQRLRAIDAKGVISTIAGSGEQGSSEEGASAMASAMNSPRAVTAGAYARPVFADAGNRLVRALIDATEVYSAASLTPRTSTVTMSAPASMVYGSAPVKAGVQGSAGTPQGLVTLTEGTTALARSELNGGSASFAVEALGVGKHSVIAGYAGDGFNPAAQSVAADVLVTPASVVISAQDVTVGYGAALPALAGAVTGILPQDSGRVQAVFSSSATAQSPVGRYPITAVLSGPASGNYSASLASGSGAVHVTQAASITTMAAPGPAYGGLSLVLNATVAPGTSGVPGGTVNFLENGAVVASGTLAGGRASAVYVAPSAGIHTLTAVYGGDNNFLPSTSVPATASVGAMPDFTVAVDGNSAQTVGAGTVAMFSVAVAASPGPFSGAVSMSVSGLPAGTAVTFTPATLVPGNGTVVTTMSVPTAALLADGASGVPRVLWYALLFPLVLVVRRRSGRVVVCACLLAFLAGCGTRTVSEGVTKLRTYGLTVTATSTNLAGAVVSHSAQASLTVE